MRDEPDKTFNGLGWSVADNSNTMLAYWDKDLICRYASKAYLHWFGVDHEKMIDKMHIKELLGQLYEQNLPYINGVLSGKICVFDRHISLPNGQTKKNRANYFPDVDEGVVKGFYVNISDVSEISTDPIIDWGLDVFDQTVNNFKSVKDVLGEVVETLRSHLFEEFPGIELLAKKHYISESKLKRDFKEKYGETIFGYYRNLQMEVAYEYITSKKANKGQMAVLLNFSNPSNFSACYRKYIEEKHAYEKHTYLKHIKHPMGERDGSYNESCYLTLIEQTPLAIAMVDNNLAFLAASQKFITEYKLQSDNYIGKSLYDFWPRSRERYQYMLNACLKGKINKSDGDYVEKIDGSPGWLRWDIRPWYKNDKSIGGLIIYTEDITAAKLKDIEYKQLSAVLDFTMGLSK